MENTSRPPQGPELENDLAKGWLRPPVPAGDVQRRGDSGFRTDAKGALPRREPQNTGSQGRRLDYDKVYYTYLL